MSLSLKQQKFADEYLIDLNATQAAIRAGYSPKSAEQQGSRLLSNAKVRAYIDQRMAEHSRRTGINQERIIRELARLALVNPANVVDMLTGEIKPTATEDDLNAVQSVKVKTIGYTDDGEPLVEREVRFHDKNRALELLGKRFGMWLDRQQVDVQGAVQIVDDVPHKSEK